MRGSQIVGQRQGPGRVGGGVGGGGGEGWKPPMELSLNGNPKLEGNLG